MFRESDVRSDVSLIESKYFILSCPLGFFNFRVRFDLRLVFYSGLDPGDFVEK